MDYDTICKKVSELDPKIRFVGIINQNGRLVSGGMREGISSLEDARDDEMLYMELVLRAKMRKEFDKVLGPVEFAMSYREKLTIMSFPLDNNVLLVSGEKGIDFTNIPFKILKIIHS